MRHDHHRQRENKRRGGKVRAEPSVERKAGGGYG